MDFFLAYVKDSILVNRLAHFCQYKCVNIGWNHFIFVVLQILSVYYIHCSSYLDDNDDTHFWVKVDDRVLKTIMKHVFSACSFSYQEYCLHPSESVINQAPKMLSSLHPHVDCITHLEMCIHSGRLFLISASVDCSLALSFLSGVTIGTFGQVSCTQCEIGTAFVPVSSCKGCL